MKRFEAYKDILAKVLEQLKDIHSKDFDLDTFMQRITRSLETEQVAHGG